ncbi:MAG: flagellar basal-body MS-ring/collar protein FliF [Salinispira sp.]
MGDFFKKLFDSIRNVWSDWSIIQRVIFVSVLLAAVIALTAIIGFSAAPSMEPVLTQGITNEILRQQIGARLDAEGITYTLTSDFVFMVDDRPTALRARAILATEGLLPGDTDAWELFDMDRWIITDYERDVNLRRSITNQLIQHIEALDDIDDASVTIVIPEKTLFAEDQDPVTASIILIPKPGSDITGNRAKLEGIQELVQFAVPGLTAEYTTIADASGRTLNDFEDLAGLDHLEQSRRELDLKRDLENQYIKAITSALAGIFTTERIEILNIEVDLDYGNKEIETEEFFPIVVTPDDPTTPFSEREVVLNALRSASEFDEAYTGSGFNPQGPPGVEGQTPPSYQDLEGLVGTYNRNENSTNYELNRQVTRETGTPKIKRISVGVAIDGIWRWKYNEQGEVIFLPDNRIDREYISVSNEELSRATELIQGAVGYSQSRGDVVTVRTIAFDRTSEHQNEDQIVLRQFRTQQIIPIVIIIIIAVIVLFILFRIVVKELERRRRLREEELARQHQSMREEALRRADETGMEVEMSVDERSRIELQEAIINMVREQPEEVAHLIRTWLSEE